MYASGTKGHGVRQARNINLLQLFEVIRYIYARKLTLCPKTQFFLSFGMMYTYTGKKEKQFTDGDYTAALFPTAENATRGGEVFKQVTLII